MFRNPKLALALIALAIPALAIPALSSAGEFETSLKAKLKGSNEVPGPGDPKGKGKIDILIDLAENKNVCFNLELKKLSGATAGHIHKGDPDEAGKIKVVLFETEIGNGAVEGCVKAKDKLAEKLSSKPDKFYVNIHNEDYPDGGCILRPGAGRRPASVQARSRVGAGAVGDERARAGAGRAAAPVKALGNDRAVVGDRNR